MFPLRTRLESCVAFRFVRPRAANLSLSTVVDYEKSRRDVSADAVAAKAALEAAGVEFTNSKRPGVRLKLGGA